MPIFEYACTFCGVGFERLCARAAADIGADCPACGGPARRRVSACAVRRSTAAAASRAEDRDLAKKERLALPLDERQPKVALDNRPPVPHRYLKHMLEHGGC